jgi:lipoprotein-releasing system ATP-binding protein
MLKTNNLTFEYGPTKQFSFPDLTCNSAETLLILGQSGTGKTTLLHLLAMLLKPTSGSITMANEAVESLSAKEAASFRARHVGIVYQRPHFVASLSVLDNILLANYLANQPQQTSKAKKLAETLGLSELLGKKISQLSLGEQQRVSIARALMNNPTLVLADEPTSSLDDQNCQRVVQLLQQQTQEIGASLVIVTHDQRLKEVFEKSVSL